VNHEAFKSFKQAEQFLTVVVTRTKFGRGGGSPCSERFVSEDAERAAGCEMALDIERVLGGGVNRQESLG
jgi:hypothetical protein